MRARFKKFTRCFLPKRKINNKIGSFAVFAVMAFCSMMILLTAVIASAKAIAIDGSVNSLGNLWGKNILSEYDLVLKDRYGILAFYGDEKSIEKKLDMYKNYSLAEKEYITCSDAECELDGYRMTSTENLKNQIEKIVAEGFGTLPRADNNEEHSTKTQENHTLDGVEKPRYVNSQWIIKSLPSYNKTEDVYVLGLINKIKAGIGIEAMVENAAVDKYIFDFFTDCMQESDRNKSYFNCEIEYIISGELSDEKSKNETGKKIKTLRNMLNLYYLYSCPEKRDGAMAIASVITPGEAAALTQAALLEAWAWAEAENDLELLYKNRHVPLIKTDESWALTLENVISSDIMSVVEPKSNKGYGYADYLKILMCGLPEETKLLRIMDLIQINMKFTYCDYFLLEDYNCGLSYSLNVNGKKYEFKDEY